MNTLTLADVELAVIQIWEQARAGGFVTAGVWHVPDGDPTTDPTTGRLIQLTTSHDVELVPDTVTYANSRQYSLKTDARKYLMLNGGFDPRNQHEITIAGQRHTVSQVNDVYGVVYEVFV